jgi:NhaP-type Na+/H+ or K+/H+ antiporter
MHHPPLDSPSLTVALALAVGMLAQSLARHLRLPGIVVLLGAGVLLGPDALDLVRPALLGPTLHDLVGFAVAVILFEGGMNLQLRRLRREAHSIRRLVTLGALVTAAGGALSARLILGWAWTPALLFGCLVIVTGPTVITPLLRRIRVTPKVATVLEAEGVLGDAVGAVVAVVALEIAISPSLGSVARGPWGLASRIGLGAAVGLAGGLLIALLLRRRHVVPEGLENVFALAFALLVFQTSGALLAESGIVAVTVAGMVVGNMETVVLSDLKEFKEQLTTLLIGMLFVLLAADTRVAEVRALGWPGVLTVLALMLVVRPLNVLVGTSGSDLAPREKAFMAWLAPRGIVAAAVASLFAHSLDVAGVPGGSKLRALVFLVIAITVAVQGLTGGLVARVLGVARRSNQGFVIVGANDLGRAFGAAFQEAGEEVVFLDSNHDACRAAEKAGFRVLHGSGFNESILMRAGLDGRAGALAATANDEVNLLFARLARTSYRVPRVWAALRKGHVSVTPEMVRQVGASVLFGSPRSLELWTLRLERGLARIETFRRGQPPSPGEGGGNGAELFDPELEQAFLPLFVRRDRALVVVDEALRAREGDELGAVVFQEARDAVLGRLQAAGWVPVPEAGA